MSAPKTILVVHHTVSPSLAELVEAAVAGVRHPGLEGAARAHIAPALSANAHDVLEADGYVLVAPVNIGYMAGALKHFFDTIYYPCLTATVGRPYALVMHGNNDVVGGVRSVEVIAGALEWTRVHEPIEVIGAPDRATLEAVVDLAGTVAATSLDP